MADYIPHTEEEVKDMLEFLGMWSMDDLFAHIPSAIRVAGGLDIPEGISEPDAAEMFAHFGRNNAQREGEMVCFAGAGAYDHEVPSVVRALASRSEFVTAYTPYQPEVAQGVLQAIFEYQTLVSRISGLPIPNASLYDGATGLTEALNMAGGATSKTVMLVSAGVHPHWRQVARTFARGTGHQIVEVPLEDGVTKWASAPTENVGAVVAAYPNFLGVMEDLTAARDLATRAGALFIVGADPIAAAVLKTAGEWGADIFVAEGQPFGTALSFGGPYLGLFACTEEQIRRLPGRIVGETLDVNGRRSFVTTLRAREQDIRREKATSNICSNQTLMAVAAAIQLGWLGTQGYREVALRSARGAKYLREQLVNISGVSSANAQPSFREFAVKTKTSPQTVIERMGEMGYLAGVSTAALGDSGEDLLVVSVTERRTKDQIDGYVRAMEKAVA
jgi:glycine dehydrogenase subunit 1